MATRRLQERLQGKAVRATRTAPVARGDVVRLLGQAALAMTVFGVWPRAGLAAEVTEESALVKGCRLPGQKCRKNKDCCSRKCRGGTGRCGCINKGSKPLVKTPLGPVPIKALCCSNKLNKLTGECK